MDQQGDTANGGEQQSKQDDEVSSLLFCGVYLCHFERHFQGGLGLCFGNIALFFSAILSNFVEY